MVVTHHLRPWSTGSHKVKFFDRYCLSCKPTLLHLPLITTLCCTKVSQMIQLQTPGQISDLQQMIATTKDCISDIKSWKTQTDYGSLKIKTDILLAIPSKFKNSTLAAEFHLHQWYQYSFFTSSPQPKSPSIQHSLSYFKHPQSSLFKTQKK